MLKVVAYIYILLVSVSADRIERLFVLIIASVHSFLTFDDYYRLAETV